MRISDWSSDVCSSDLADAMRRHRALRPDRLRNPAQRLIQPPRQHRPETGCKRRPRQIVKIADMAQAEPVDRQSDEWGKRVSVRVDLGGRRIIKKKRTTQPT